MVAWLEIAITAPSASYVATSQMPIQESLLDKAYASAPINSRPEVARMVSTGDQRWACIPIRREDPAADYATGFVAIERIFATGRAITDLPRPQRRNLLINIRDSVKRAALE